jgi:hypothetical protein
VQMSVKFQFPDPKAAAGREIPDPVFAQERSNQLSTPNLRNAVCNPSTQVMTIAKSQSSSPAK